MKKLLLLLGLSGCAALEEKVIGMENIESKEPGYFDLILGDFTYREDGSVDYLCDECVDPIDVSVALEKVGFYENIDRLTEEGIDNILAYGIWNMEDTTYSREDSWINLDCPDMNYFSAWAMSLGQEYGMEFYDYPNSEEEDVDSFLFLTCIYRSTDNDCNPDISKQACQTFDYFSNLL